ncbi:hypothetical protein PHMEG_00014681 [Phytophthora megakarya]|uniref:Uncharacterized protein n=1 Tax=Phytophthora megakarya TaxID=4795 RepID=A0A225W4R6_9STRA|nr:hypothetical protein PHMEG_00014681 [Phytophthora megakarya]
MWSMTGGATQNMQFAHVFPAGMVFAAQGGVAQPEGSLGVQVTEAVLPVWPIPANPDDVVMSESGRAIVRSDNMSRTSRKYAHRRRSSPSDDSPSVQRRRSETPAFETFKAFIQTVAKSSEMTSRSGGSRYSATSGASQVALNAMRSTQDMLAQMESKQYTTQAELNQRVGQAFQAIQMLAARPGVVKSVTVPNVKASTDPAQVSTGPAEAVPSAKSHEGIRALKAAETQFEERWQRREAEAEKAKESWAVNLQKSLNDQWESVMSARCNVCKRRSPP